MSSINVVLLHSLTRHSRYATVQDNLAFGRFAENADVKFINIHSPELTERILGSSDLVILTNDFLSLRSSPRWHSAWKPLSKILRDVPNVAFFPQDDYTSNRELNKSILQVPHALVFSPLEHVKEYLYHPLVQDRVRPWLTGFVDVQSKSIYERFDKRWNDREFDLAQRVTKLSPRFGTEGLRKSQIAEDLAEKAKELGLAVDVSSNENDMFSGSDWLKFLGNTRYVIGRLSGASLISKGPLSVIRANAIEKVYRSDSDAQLVERIRGKQKEHPYLAISPRIFESASLGNCQVLEEGDYPGNLLPWVDYVPISKDLSNIDEVIEFMRFGDGEGLARSAYRKLVESEEFHQKTWVSRFFAEFQDHNNAAVFYQKNQESGVVNQHSKNSDESKESAVAHKQGNFKPLVKFFEPYSSSIDWISIP